MIWKLSGMAKNGEEAVELVNEHQPDICIMDIEMPVKTGLDAAEELKGEAVKIIILTTFARSGYFERARKAGVRGYLLKDSPIEELVIQFEPLWKDDVFMRRNWLISHSGMRYHGKPTD